MPRPGTSSGWAPGLGIGILLVSLSSGCQPPTTVDQGPVASASQSRAEDGVPAIASSPAPAIRAQVADAAALQQILRDQAGRVVLIDFWATWCIPCTQQFPHLVSLHRELNGQGLTVISVSLDDPAQKVEVLRFLQQQDAGFTNLISQFGTSSQTADAFDLRGDVPLVKLYDRSGQLRYQFSGDPTGLEHGQPLEQIDARVHELLAERTP